jgi:predicted enzyme related to lactoylglutathione lyase
MERGKTMLHPNHILFFVENTVSSTEFYASLFDCEPVEASLEFALFSLSSGLQLGLWSRYHAEPLVITRGGGTELGIPVADDDALHALYSDWKTRGLAIVQPPTDMRFGRSFVALDPDGHRLRVFRLGVSGGRRAGRREGEVIAT